MPVVSLSKVHEDDRLGLLMAVEDEKKVFLLGQRGRVVSTKFRALGRVYSFKEYSEDYRGVLKGLKNKYAFLVREGLSVEIDFVDMLKEKSPPPPPPPPPNSPAGDVLDLTDAIARSVAAQKLYYRTLQTDREATPSPPPNPPPNSPVKSK